MKLEIYNKIYTLGRAPLVQAVKTHDLKKIKEIIKSNPMRAHDTIVFAIIQNDALLIQRLITNSLVNVNSISTDYSENDHPETPLNIALITQASSKVIEILINNNANFGKNLGREEMKYCVTLLTILPKNIPALLQNKFLAINDNKEDVKDLLHHASFFYAGPHHIQTLIKSCLLCHVFQILLTDSDNIPKSLMTKLLLSDYFLEYWRNIISSQTLGSKICDLYSNIFNHNDQHIAPLLKSKISQLDGCLDAIRQQFNIIPSSCICIDQNTIQPTITR